MATRKKRIVLTGGGTAGHVTPNVALIPYLQEGGYEVYYIGRKSGIEKDLIENDQLPYFGINSGKLRRYFDWKNFSDLFRIFHGLIQSIFLMIKIKPDILFSKGGFVSCPPVWAAWLLRIPVAVHESDMTPGLANKLSQPFAKKVCLTFSETVKHVDSNKSVITGLPIRTPILLGDKNQGLALCQFTDKKPVLMVMGGSQGAKKINQAIRASLDKLLSQFQICHLCGKGNLSGIQQSGYYEVEYIREDLPHLFAMTDLIISRAGATSIFEILALQLPNILIPLDAGSRGDQILNAASFEQSGFSKVLPEKELTSESLIQIIHETYANREQLISSMRRAEMSNAVEKIVRVFSEILQSEKTK